MHRMLVVFVVALASAAACKRAAAAEHPFLQGQVTDEQGRPIEGATVYIADCIGTCLGGDGRLTDKLGRYRFESKTFRNFPALSVSMPGRYHVSTDYAGPKLHDESSSLARVANFVLGTPAAVTVRVKGSVPEGWTQSVSLRAGRDATLHRYDQTGVHNEGWETWSFPLVPRSESYHVVVSHQPRIEPTADRKELRARRSESRSKMVETVSPPIRFADPVRYTVQAELTDGDEEQPSQTSITSIVDILGEDRTKALVVDDPLFGAPAQEEDQQRGRQLLERVALAAIPWNAKPADDIDAYRYTAIDAGQNRTEIEITKSSSTGPSWTDISRIRGFAYMPPLRWLFNQPENVVFYKVTVDDHLASLVYRLKERRGHAFGIGVGPGWNGFSSRSFSCGRITIDPVRSVVLEHRFSSGLLGKELSETFADYVPIGDGYAPQTIEMDFESLSCQLRFKVHDEALWLLDQVTRAEQEDPVFRIKDVVVERVSSGNSAK